MGKSTLLNALTDSQVSVKDRVFETLDTVNRRLYLPGVGEAIVTDTVGFIRDLPKDLVVAFQTTLHELQEADVLLHVIDAHVLDPAQHILAVENILRELGVDKIPRLRFFNKADLCQSESVGLLKMRYGGIGGSALERKSIEVILRELTWMLKDFSPKGSARKGVEKNVAPDSLASAGVPE